MEDFGTGVITKLESGRWDNQYNVEITLLDGTKLNGFDGIQVYEKKKDGSEAKVWPMVKNSYMNGVAYEWKGNTKASDTRGGTKTYATIVFAEGPQDSDGAGGPPSGLGPVGDSSSSAPSDHSTWDDPPPDTWGARPVETVGDPTVTVKRDETTRQIEAAWAIGVLAPHIGNNPEALHAEAHKLIVLKHQIASELE